MVQWPRNYIWSAVDCSSAQHARSPGRRALKGRFRYCCVTNKSLDNALWLVVAVCSYLNLGPQAKEAFRWVGLCSRICTSQVGKREEEHHWWWWERMVRPTSSTNGWWVMSSPAFFLNFCFCMQVVRRRRGGRRRVVVGGKYICLSSLRVAWMEIQICNDTCIFCFSFGFRFRWKVSFLSLYIL